VLGGAVVGAAERAWRELARALRPEGRAGVNVLADEELPAGLDASLSPVLRTRIRLAGALADIVVLARDDGALLDLAGDLSGR
jgi:hypothetical protein